MASFTIRALDAFVTINAAAPLGGLLSECLADLRVGEHGSPATRHVDWSIGGDGRWLLTLDGDGYVSAGDVAGGLAETLIAINRWAAESVALTAAPLHAGVFAAEGKAVALAGRSGAGKSTLLAAALQAGHTFVAEEVCAVTDDGLVRHYPRPIGLRAGGAAALGLEVPGGADGVFGAIYPWRAPMQGTASAGLSLIALVTRRAGATSLEPVSPPDALRRLTDLTIGGAEGRSLFRRLERLVREIEVIDVQFSDSSDASSALADYVRTR